MAHFLRIEGLIIARLQAAVGAAVPVLSHAALPEIASGSRPAPALVVLYGGGEVTESRADGLAVRVAQEWMVLLVARELLEAPDGTTAPGPLADAVLSALLGWRPDGESKALQLSALPPPEYVNGNQWLPLTFVTEIVRRVAPDA